MDEMDVLEADVETFLNQNPVFLSDSAKLSFGMVRASKRYRFTKRFRSWASRYDDIEIRVSESQSLPLERRWFARCVGFVTVGKLHGIIIQSYILHDLTKLYPEQTHDNAVLKWWPEKCARHKGIRLSGDIIHLKIVSLDVVKSKVHIVPDWSHQLLLQRSKRQHSKWQNQRFFLNHDYIMY